MELIFSIAGGLVVSLVFQLMLTNLGVAFGLTALGWLPGSATSSADEGQSDTPSETAQPDQTDSSSPARSLPVTHLLGFGVATSLSLIIFASALLSAEFSQILDPRRGIIYGLIFWAVYWLLLLWFSSTTAINIADSLLGTALSGARQLVSTFQQALPNKEKDSAPSDRTQTNQSMIKSLAMEVAKVADVQQTLPSLLAEQRETLLDEIQTRTQLSATQVTEILKEIEAGTSEQTDQHKDQSDDQSDNITAEASISVPTASLKAASSSTLQSRLSSQLLSQLSRPDWKQLASKVVSGQIDLSEITLQKLWQQVPSFIDSDEVEQAHSAIGKAAEAYLRNAPAWSLQPDALEEVFTEQLIDLRKTPDQMIDQLSQIDKEQMVYWLGERKDLGLEKVEAIASQFTSIQSNLIDTLTHQKEAEAAKKKLQVDAATTKLLQSKLITYCRYTNLASLTPEHLTDKIQSQLEEHSIDSTEHLSIDLPSIEDVISRRNKITKEQKEALTHSLQLAFSPKLSSSSEMNAADGIAIPQKIDSPAQSSKVQRPSTTKTIPVQAKPIEPSLPEKLKHQVIRYLRNQDRSAFQPETIAKDIAQIVSSAFSSAAHAAHRAADQADDLPDFSHIATQFGSQISSLWDRSLWETELAKRRDMTTEEIQQILDWGESAWKPAAERISTWTQMLQTEASELLSGGLSDSLPDGHFLESARQQIVEQISTAQVALKEQTELMKVEVQAQAEAVRKQVAIAAWWLFTALLFSGIAAGGAGWLAAVY